MDTEALNGTQEYRVEMRNPSENGVPGWWWKVYGPQVETFYDGAPRVRLDAELASDMALTRVGAWFAVRWAVRRLSRGPRVMKWTVTVEPES